MKRRPYIFLLSSLLVGSLWAAPVELGEAIPVAQTWMAQRGRPCQAVSGCTYAVANGNGRFHIVQMANGGFVALAGDDELDPVLAFSDAESVSCEPGSPLHALLSKHVQEDRPSVVESAVDSLDLLGEQTWTSLNDSPQTSRAQWRNLKKSSGNATLVVEAATAETTAGVSSLKDVRRSPLVKSEWGQTKTRGWGNYCFNIYTPNGYPCGCVATAMAQLMRYHAYPSGKIGSVTKTCQVNGTKYLMKTIGGSYDWANMPLDPTWTISETKLRAIGKLAYDCGVSVNMMYTPTGSGAESRKIPAALRDVFKYSQVKSMTPGLSTFKKILVANLDYGKPLILAISGDIGHAVVADGYGYDANGTLYTHLNMGWDGSGDVWYRLPKFTADGKRFTTIDYAFYNIFTKGTGNIVSGRVVDTKGLPVEGAVVSFGSTTVKTTANGIFALRTSAQSGTLRAKRGTVSSSSKSVTISSGVSSGTTLVLNLAKVENLANALDNSKLTFTTGGSAKWFYQTAVSLDGTDAARSGAIGSDASSYLATTLSGRGWLCFWWKADCEDGWTSSDYLKFYADDSLKWRLTGTGNSWIYHECFFADAETHTAKWVYVKDWSFSSGQDCGWVDRVQWKPAVRILLDPGGGAVASNVLYFAKDSSCGSLPEAVRPRHVFDGWYAADGTRVKAGTWLQNDVVAIAHWTENRVPVGDAETASYETTAENSWVDEGNGMFRSGTLNHMDTNALIRTVSGPGLLRFTWRPSSEANCDWGIFEVDGKEVARISGVSNDYAQVVWTTAEAGRHVLRWNYAKNPSAIKGEDCIRVRDVEWHPQVDVVFDANGGTIDGAASVTNSLYAGLLLGSGTCPSPVRVGYEFVGWFTHPQDGNPVDEEMVVPTEGCCLYAHWLNVVDLMKVLDGPGIFDVTTGGDSSWFGETLCSADGVDAARSGSLVAGQSNWLEVHTSGKGRLRFKWKRESSRAGDGDRLLFQTDGGPVEILGNAEAWTEKVVACEEGEHVFRWTYEQLTSEWRVDCAYVDQVIWEPTVPSPLAFTGTWLETNGIWGVSYQAPGGAGDGQTAQVAVEGPGQLSFDAWIAEDSPTLAFEWSLDGVVQGAIDATAGKTNIVLSVREAGRHLIGWQVRKPENEEVGGSGIWLDHLVWRSGSFVDVHYQMDGLVDETIFVPARESIELLWDEWLNGYELAGWMTETAEELPVRRPFTPDGNVTLIAKWCPAAVWSPDGVFSGTGTRTYQGYVWNGTNVIGSITVKAVKTSVTATIRIGTKSYVYTGGRASTKTGVVGSLRCTRNKNGLALRLGVRGVEGTYAGKYEIHGARSSVPETAYRRGWSISLGDGKVTGRLLLKIDSKGGAKIAGTTATGEKISASSRVIVGKGYVLVPVVSGSKKALIRISAEGVVTLVGSNIGTVVEAGSTTRPQFTGWMSSANSMVGVAYSARATVTERGRPLTFSATGIPPGLVLSKSTGALSGVPTRVGTFVTRIKAISTYNGKWYSYLTVTNRISALPAWARGTFSGAIEGIPPEDDTRGSVGLSVGTTGAMSGKALLLGTNWTLNARSYSASSVTAGLTNLVAAGTATSVKTISGKKVTSRTPFAFSLVPPRDPVWFDSMLVGTFGDLDFGALRSIWKDSRDGSKAATLLSGLLPRYDYTNESGTAVLVLKPVIDAKTGLYTGQVTVGGTFASPEPDCPLAKRTVSLSVPILYAWNAEREVLTSYVIIHVPAATVSVKVKTGTTKKTVNVRHGEFWTRIELQTKGN